MTHAKQLQYANVKPLLTTSSSDFSPASSVSSTPQSNDAKEPKRGRGCPYKECGPVTYSDFPVNWYLNEQEHWFKAKTTERWQNAKLKLNWSRRGGVQSGWKGQKFRVLLQ